MNWSILSLLVSILPIAGLLLAMHWVMRQGDDLSRLIGVLTGRHQHVLPNDDGNRNAARATPSDARPKAHPALTSMAFVTTLFMVGESASAHEIPWRQGETRQVGFGSCSKGACMKRTCWSKFKPHRHVHGKVVFDGRGNSSCWSKSARDR